MKYNYAFYCSGSASRVLNFYEVNNCEDYLFEFVYYDGGKIEIENLLIKKFGASKTLFPDRGLLKNRKDLGRAVNSDLFRSLQECNVDYLFCFGDIILRPQLVDSFKNKIINFHPSILPSFPGLNAIDQALRSSVQFLGNTAHFIDYGIDTGLIILQAVIPRGAVTGYDSVLDLQLAMLKKIWNWLEADKIKIVKEVVVIEIDDIQKPSFSS